MVTRCSLMVGLQLHSDSVLACIEPVAEHVQFKVPIEHGKGHAKDHAKPTAKSLKSLALSRSVKAIRFRLSDF